LLYKGRKLLFVKDIRVLRLQFNLAV
ncbi:unnamed protein product, partial [Acanthoscelides obtectus]